VPHPLRLTEGSKPLHSLRAKAAALVLLFLPGLAGAAINQYITVEPAAPLGASPAPLTILGDPVTVGIPLTVADSISSWQQLGISGTSAYQFRIGNTDSVSGYRSLAFGTFLANGGPYTVTSSGLGKYPTTDSLAIDVGDTLVVNTGPASFLIKQKGFNFLNAVYTRWAGVSMPVKRHAWGGIAVQFGATTYSSANDDSCTVSIFENGPAAAIIKAEGMLKSGTARSTRLMDYTCYLHFYKGQSWVRAEVILKNARYLGTGGFAAKYFDSARVTMPVTLTGTRQIAYGTPTGVDSATIATAGYSYLYQACNQKYYDTATANVIPYLTPDQGLKIVGATKNNILGNTADVAPGWMRLKGTNCGVYAGIRNLASYFPAGFYVGHDTLSVEMFSKFNSQDSLVFSWGAHDSRQIFLDFGDPNAGWAKAATRTEYPLVARLPYEFYASQGAFDGETRLVSFADEQRFFSTELGKTWPPTNKDFRYGATTVTAPRQYSFPTTGGGNQFDQDCTHLLDYLRTGYAGRFVEAYLGTKFKADQAVPWSDDIDWSLYHKLDNNHDEIKNNDVPASTGGFNGKGMGNQFDNEHPHWDSMAWMYGLTGDEHLKDAVNEYLQWRYYRANVPNYGVIWAKNPMTDVDSTTTYHGFQHHRLWSRALRDMALGYNYTGKNKYLTRVKQMTRVLLASREAVALGDTLGRNPYRGFTFFNDDSTVTGTRQVHLFYLNEIEPEGDMAAMRLFKHIATADTNATYVVGDSLYQGLRDYMTGLAYFCQEARVAPNAIGYVYDYPTRGKTLTVGTRGDQTGYVFAHGYENTGDSTFAYACRDMAWRVPEYQHWLRGSELPEQARIWTWLNRQNFGVEHIAATQVVTIPGDSSLTLVFTVPPGATEIIARMNSAADTLVGRDAPVPIGTLRYNPTTARYNIASVGDTIPFWAERAVVPQMSIVDSVAGVPAFYVLNQGTFKSNYAVGWWIDVKIDRNSVNIPSRTFVPHNQVLAEPDDSDD
jgi:hypothetical protein